MAQLSDRQHATHMGPTTFICIIPDKRPERREHRSGRLHLERQASGGAFERQNIQANCIVLQNLLFGYEIVVSQNVDDMLLRARLERGRVREVGLGHHIIDADRLHSSFT